MRDSSPSPIRKPQANNTQHKPDFNTLPMKQQQGVYMPEFLPPIVDSSVKRMDKVPHIRRVSKEFNIRNKYLEAEKVLGFEGPQAYPKYTDKLAIKNVGATRHLLSKTKKISSLIWECGLRDFDTPEKKPSSILRGGARAD